MDVSVIGWVDGWIEGEQVVQISPEPALWVFSGVLAIVVPE